MLVLVKMKSMINLFSILDTNKQMRKKFVEVAQLQALNEMRHQQWIGASNTPSTSIVRERLQAVRVARKIPVCVFHMVFLNRVKQMYRRVSNSLNVSLARSHDHHHISSLPTSTNKHRRHQ